MQVQVRDVGAELARPGQPDHRVEVRAVDVDLAAGVVHERADLADVVLEDAVGRRVGEHDRGQRVGVLGDLGLQVVEVDLALLAAGLDDDDAHAGHHRRGGVGAVRARRDQADVAVRVAVGAVVVVDRQQPGELALRAGVGLQRHRVVAGDLGQPGLQVGEQRGVAVELALGRERVHVGEAGVGDRLHLGGGVELHRARAERDHAAVEREVAVGQPAQVAQHRRLGAVGVEHRVGQELAGARVGERRHAGVEPLDVVEAERDPEGAPHRDEVRTRVVISSQEMPTVSASTGRRLMPALRAAPTTTAARPGTRHGDGVEERRRRRRRRRPRAARRPGSRPAGGTRSRDRPQAVRAVVDGVHRGDDRQQHLRGADVARRLLAADVLLAGLQRQPVGRGAVGVDRHPDQAAGQLPLQPGAHRQVAGVRAAEAERHAEALGGAAPRCRRRPRRAG